MITWISHRGVKSATIFENTLEAFDLAVGEGYDYLETDLRMTADGHPILSHDICPSFLQSVCINERTLADLKAINFPNGQKFLTFDEFITRFTGQKWVLDIKPETAVDVIDYIGQRLQKDTSFLEQLTDRTRFLFWKKSHQQRLLQLIPQAVCFPRESECWLAALTLLLTFGRYTTAKPNAVYSVPRYVNGLDLYRTPLIRWFKEKGIPTLAFLPANERELNIALSHDFNEILYDYSRPKAD